MEKNKLKTVAFTGYRTTKILNSTKSRTVIKTLSEELENTVRMLYEKGYRTFLSGMAEGFDMLAAEAVLKIRQELPEINLIAVVPFSGQHFTYSPKDKQRYKEIIDNAYEVIFTSETYHEKAFFVRNDYLIDKSSLIVCYYNGKRGGTIYTYNRALRNNLKIINLYEVE